MARIEQLPGEKPKGVFCRRGQIVLWTGLPRAQVDAFLNSGAVVGRPLRPGGRNWYFVSEIEDKLIKPFQQQGGKS